MVASRTDCQIKRSDNKYGETQTFHRPKLEAKVNGRIDVSRFTCAGLEGRTTVETDSPGSPDLPTSAANLPIDLVFGATAGVTHRFNRFEVTGKGMVDRATYGASKLNDGSVVSNRDRNYAQYGAALRARFELTPEGKPFVEIMPTRAYMFSPSTTTATSAILLVYTAKLALRSS